MTVPDPLGEIREALQDVAGAGADRATAYERGHGNSDKLVRRAIDDALAAITRYGDARAKIAMPLARLGLLALKGGKIQDDAERLGVVQPIEVTEACGENCDCAKYGDFPLTCSLTRHRPPPSP